MDNPDPSRRNRRLAFMISGATDAAIGAVLVLLGIGFLPIDVTDYGFQNWHAILLGGIMFVIGVGTFVYNFSRLEE